jgi:hypothetical protein
MEKRQRRPSPVLPGGLEVASRGGRRVVDPAAADTCGECPPARRVRTSYNGAYGAPCGRGMTAATMTRRPAADRPRHPPGWDALNDVIDLAFARTRSSAPSGRCVRRSEGRSDHRLDEVTGSA